MPSKYSVTTNQSSVTRRKFLGRLVAAGVAAAIPTAAYGHAEIDDLEVVRKTIPLKSFPKDARPLKVGFISDFHCTSEHALKRIARAAELLKGEGPDIVVLGGDYVTHIYQPWAQECLRALSPLNNAPLGSYAILGNHDWWCYGIPLIRESIEKTGFELMSNRSLQLSANGIWLVGLDDCLEHKQDLELAMRHVPQDEPKILLVHEPDYADSVPAGFMLQLSGHSHGGQVRVFNHALHEPGMGRKYDIGLKQSPTHPVYTTRGVGVIGPAIRLACRPEVSVLTLTAPAP